MKTIMVFARAPQRGRVKTRLARQIGEQAALEVYVAMLRDSLAGAEHLARAVGGEVVLAHTPREAMELGARDGAPSLRELWSGAAWPQPQGDLGERMHGAIAWAFESGAESVALLGADTPDMDVGRLARNFGALQRAAELLDVVLDVVLEPAQDGGFWALMCSRALPREAFELEWSQDETCAPLQANLEALGLRVQAQRTFPLGDDVDDLPALRRLGERLRANSHLAPCTATWMHENGWL